MTRHTPGPWRTGPADNGIDLLYGGDGKHFANLRPMEYDPEGANVARIVQCVNACEGIEDPAAALAEVRAALLDIETFGQGAIQIRAAQALGLLGYPTKNKETA